MLKKSLEMHRRLLTHARCHKLKGSTSVKFHVCLYIYIYDATDWIPCKILDARTAVDRDQAGVATFQQD